MSSDAAGCRPELALALRPTRRWRLATNRRRHLAKVKAAMGSEPANRVLDVSLDELCGTGKPAVCGKRGPVSQLECSIERIGELPKQKQRFVMEMLETVLAQDNDERFSLAAKKEAVPEPARSSGMGTAFWFKVRYLAYEQGTGSFQAPMASSWGSPICVLSTLIPCRARA